MRILKLCLLCLLASLSACTTSYSTLKTESSTLTGVAQDQEQFYLLTNTHYAYAFPKTELLGLLEMLQSDLGLQISHFSSAIDVVQSSNKAKATFYIYIAAHQLNDQQKDDLLNKHQYTAFKPDAYSFVHHIAPLEQALKHTDTLYIKQEKINNGLQVERPEAFTMALPFPEPVEVKITYVKGSLRSTPNLIESIIWAPFILPTIPLSAISN